MKATIFYPLFFWSIFMVLNTANAQDVITLKTGEEISGYRTEITDSLVQYKRYNSNNGRVYTYTKDEVSSVWFEDGRFELISSVPKGNVLKKRVCIGNIKDGSGWKNGSASDRLSALFSTELFKSGKYHVVEQESVADLIKDGNLSPANLQKLANAGVQLLVLGSITEFGMNTESKTESFVYFAQHSTDYTAKVAFDVKVMDVTTGEILFAETARGSLSDSRKGVAVGGISSVSGGFDETLLDNATRIAIQQTICFLDKGTEKIKWNGSIAKVMDDKSTVYIKPGSNDGVQIGMEFRVFDTSEQIIDPDLGIILSSTEKIVGKIKVIELVPNGKAAKCLIIEGSGFKIGNIVRID